MTKNSSIDILPMACVGLLLVIMMIMTAPMTMTHTSTMVTVPLTHTSERKTEEDVTITLAMDGKLYLNDQPTDKLNLNTQLNQMIKKDPYCLVVVRADKDVFHKDVLDLIAIAKQAGAIRIACATKKMKE